ncbi:protein kinase domain-containing protein [Actinomadura bangladeshensis]|uniref:Protein kinase domain-containing protein n=1 Tax=Actinomadura bangladeshensis TaxID=453573 RepID=A0A4R4P1S6_9ACTN|nr:hypothetical protein [Actinomadura bangladeshensis]TDC15514.1 hypothetical protein E1284_15225 [Actinomadura bangladeshensis]
MPTADKVSGRRSRRLRPGDILHDDRGEALELVEEIGGGGQGTVWSLTGGRAAVKIVKPGTGMAPDRLRGRLAAVRRYDLAGIPIARPLSLLTGDHVGYTMELLDAMTNLGSLAAPEADVKDWFVRTGGLARRLRLLALAAEAFARLHARGLAYGDISPGNVLVSANSGHDQVWLIDPDNLSVESGGGEPVYFTRGYGAPEVVDDHAGQDSLTDVYSFAVLAFEILTLVHPFQGDAVYADPERLEEAAFAGRLPWIDHSSDDGNRSSLGLARPTVLTRGLQTLARRTFEDGLRRPARRPGMEEWHDKLHQAALLMVPCPDCASTYHGAEARCPWCGRERPPILRCDVHGRLPAGCVPGTDGECETDRLLSLLLSPRQAQTVRARTAVLHLDRGPADLPIDPGEPVVQLDWDGRARVTVQRVGRHPTRMVDRIMHRSIPLGTGDIWPIDMDETGQWSIHFGPPDEPHRFLRLLRSRQGAR